MLETILRRRSTKRSQRDLVLDFVREGSGRDYPNLLKLVAELLVLQSRVWVENPGL